MYAAGLLHRDAARAGRHAGLASYGVCVRNSNTHALIQAM